MKYPDSDRVVNVLRKDRDEMEKARFIDDAPMPHWRRTEGDPMSNAFISMDEVEAWREEE